MSRISTSPFTFHEEVLGLEVTHRIEPVTAAFVSDLDGYQVEILQHHEEIPQGLSGPNV